jgi:hypothetical protein
MAAHHQLQPALPAFFPRRARPTSREYNERLHAAEVWGTVEFANSSSTHRSEWKLQVSELSAGKLWRKGKLKKAYFFVFTAK